jgi:hypothetical protein
VRPRPRRRSSGRCPPPRRGGRRRCRRAAPRSPGWRGRRSGPELRRADQGRRPTAAASPARGPVGEPARVGRAVEHGFVVAHHLHGGRVGRPDSGGRGARQRRRGRAHLRSRAVLTAGPARSIPSAILWART